MSDSPPIEASDFRYVRLVAQYRPFSSGEYRVALASRQLVLAAIHASGGRSSSCIEAQSACRAILGLEFERHEVAAAVDQLEDDEKLVRTDSGVMVSASASRELAARVRTSKEVEATAFREWDEVIRRKVAPS